MQEQAILFEQKVTNGLVLDSDVLLDDLIDRWFEEYANKRLKPKTVYDYKRMRPQISAGLGHLKVSKIKPAQIMAFYDNLEEKGIRRDSTYTATPALLKLLPHGTRGVLAKKAGIGLDTMRMVYAGRKVSRQTAEKVFATVGLAFSKVFVEHRQKGGKLNNNSILHYHAMLSSVFKKGIQWGLIDENPCSRAERPKTEEVDVQMLGEDEIPKLLDALSDAPPQYSLIVQLALLIGARRGEICALRWSDIDLEKAPSPSTERYSSSRERALYSILPRQSVPDGASGSARTVWSCCGSISAIRRQSASESVQHGYARSRWKMAKW